jgi:hypothetical protein
LAGQLGRFASSLSGAHVSDFLSKIDNRKLGREKSRAKSNVHT